MLRVLVIPAFVLAVGLGHSAELRGRAIAVADGDTITVVDNASQRHSVRLAGIDAPEKGQPSATRSRDNLARWVQGQSVVVAWHKRDQYGRLVGVVLAQGHDVNLEQIRAGLAWWFRRFASEQAAQDRALYEAAEDDARRARRGLWTDADPVPPWEWRARRPDKH